MLNNLIKNNNVLHLCLGLVRFTICLFYFNHKKIARFAAPSSNLNLINNTETKETSRTAITQVGNPLYI